MATLTPTLTLASTDALSDAINFSVTDTLALTDYGKLRKHVVISPDDVTPGGTKIYSTAQGKGYVYVKNIHASLTLWLAPAADTATTSSWMELAPSEFAYFPWAGAVDLYVHTGANGQGIATDGCEVMVFEA